MQTLLDHYPSLERRLSLGVWKTAAPVLAMLVQGEIPLLVPACTVFDGLWRCVANMTDITGAGRCTGKVGGKALVHAGVPVTQGER